MNITPVRFNSIQNRNFAPVKTALLAPYTPNDTVSFTGTKGTTGFLSKIFSFFKPEEIDKDDLSFEEQMDFDIRDFLDTLLMTKKAYIKEAKEEYQLLSLMLKVGKKFDYKGYIPFNDDRRMLFGAFDKETGTPRRLDIISPQKGMKILKSYEFDESLTSFSYTNYEANNSYVKVETLNKKPFLVFDMDGETNILQRTVYLNNGLSYALSHTDDKGEVTNVETVLFYDGNNLKNSYCLDILGEDDYGFYTYDPREDFWKLDKHMSSKEALNLSQD